MCSFYFLFSVIWVGLPHFLCLCVSDSFLYLSVLNLLHLDRVNKHIKLKRERVILIVNLTNWTTFHSQCHCLGVTCGKGIQIILGFRNVLYIHTHTHTHMHTHTHTHTCVHTHKHKCAPTLCTHKHMRTRTRYAWEREIV